MNSIYVAWEWDTPHSDEPILVYVELDHARLEQRTVEYFSDGRIGFASKTIVVGDRPLSDTPFPELDFINDFDGVRAREITADEFEAVWNARSR